MNRDDTRLYREIEHRRLRVLILEAIEQHPHDLVLHVVAAANAESQMVYAEIRALVAENVIRTEGRTFNRRYYLRDAALAQRIVERLKPRVEKDKLMWQRWQEDRQRMLNEFLRGQGVAES